MTPQKHHVFGDFDPLFVDLLKRSSRFEWRIASLCNL